MKTINLSISALLLLSLFSCSNPGHKDEAIATDSATVENESNEQKMESEQPMDSATIAKAWEKYMMPGEVHQQLALQNGKWDAEIVFWPGPDLPAMPSNVSVVENKMIMGGRYQESVYMGTMMGMPFEGRGITAYDNAKNRCISTWIDNTGTGLMYMEGTYDGSSKTVNLKGKMTDPSTGKDSEIRQEIKNPDDKHQILTMYAISNGKEFKSMEIKLTKK